MSTACIFMFMAKKTHCLPDKLCPHWSLQTRSCLLSQKGLYLPVAEHVEIYCEGINYSSCSYFVRPEQQSDPEIPGDVRLNRRQHQRVPGRYALCLSENGGDVLDQLIDDAASTIDISPGGIRCESYTGLIEGSKILFSLNGDFSSPPLHGTGVVKWCRSLENAPLYHAGISFADPTVRIAVRDQLGCLDG